MKSSLTVAIARRIKATQCNNLLQLLTPPFRHVYASRVAHTFPTDKYVDAVYTLFELKDIFINQHSTLLWTDAPTYRILDEINP